MMQRPVLIRQFIKSEFTEFTDSIITYACGSIETNFFADSEVIEQGNSIFRVYHSADDEFAYPWVGTSFYRNLVYNTDYISNTLKKSMSRISKDPENTLFMFVLPDSTSVPW